MAIEERRKHSRRTPEISLESQRVKYNALIESIGEGLVVIGQDGNIEHVNAYAAAALQVSSADLIGKWFPGAIVMVDNFGNTIDPISRPVARALTEGSAVSEYTNFLRANGTTFPVHITASPIIIDGRPAGAIEVFRDLTQERELDMAKDEFVSIASHQLRTPATGIRGILSMVLSGDFGELAPKQRQYLELAMRSNDRQLDIIEDLLTVARADSGRMDLVKENVSLTRLVEEVVAEHQIGISECGQSLQVDLAPDVFALIDGEKVKMVVDNLIGNAAKYTPACGTIKVRLKHSQSHATLTVRDDGVGIPKDKQKAIFTKFMRVDNELSVPAGGTGLGLYLALKIIKLHRGDITVISDVGSGSEFRVIIPLQEPKEEV